MHQCLYDLCQRIVVPKCNQRAILEPLAVLLSPFAVHLAEELWERLGHTTSVSTAPHPVFEENIWWRVPRTIRSPSTVKCVLHASCRWICLQKKLKRSF